jgi:serine/threonine protein kinase
MDSRDVLQKNTLLDGKYRIERVLGAGGFGITYEATDIGLNRAVAIKEYYPTEFAQRDQTRTVRPRSEKHRPLFDHLRTSFLREAQILAQFEDPSIVRVISFFPAHGTAYMVMQYEVGSSMKAWLKQLNRAPTQGELDRILVNLLRALELMHSRDFLHRDIAADNIILRPDGNPVLLDFGSSRRVVAETTGTLTGIVKQGYSPPEQYSRESRSQGPWTDIYALGATLYHSVTGKMPPEGMARALEDDFVSSAAAAVGDYRHEFLEAIDWSLEVQPRQRPQSVADWRQALLSGADLSFDAFGGPTDANSENSGSNRLVSGGPVSRRASRPSSPAGSPAEETSGSRGTRNSGPALRRSSRPSSGAAPNDDDAATPIDVTAGNPLVRSRDFRKVAGLAAMVGGISLIGTMMLFGFSNDRAQRRSPVVALPVSSSNQQAAADYAQETRQAEVASRQEAERLRQSEAERQRLRVEEERRILADQERQRLEAERAKQAEAERQRLRAEAEQRLRAEQERAAAAESRRLALADQERRRLEAERAQQAEAERQRLRTETEQRLRAEQERAAAAETRRQALAEQERQRLEAERLQQAEAERQKLRAEAEERLRAEQERAAAAEAKRLALADQERKRLEAERAQQAEAEKQRLRVEAERQRAVAEARRLALAEQERTRLAAERQAQAEAERQRLNSETAEREHAEGTRRSQVLGLEQRDEFLRDVQTRMKAHKCYEGDLNGREADTLKGLAALRKHESAAPDLKLEATTVGDAETFLAWLSSRPRPACEGPTIEERKQETERVRRQQDAERARQRARNAAAAAADRKAAQRARAAASRNHRSERSSSGRSHSGGGNVSVRVPSF